MEQTDFMGRVEKGLSIEPGDKQTVKVFKVQMGQARRALKGLNAEEKNLYAIELLKYIAEYPTWTPQERAVRGKAIRQAISETT